MFASCSLEPNTTAMVHPTSIHLTANHASMATDTIFWRRLSFTTTSEKLMSKNNVTSNIIATRFPVKNDASRKQILIEKFGLRTLNGKHDCQKVNCSL